MIPSPYPKRWPRAVIFDWDGTLVDTWRVTYDALCQTCVHYGMPVPSQEDFHTAPHFSIKDSFPSVFGDLALEMEEFFHAELGKSHLDGLRPMPGSERLLQMLAGRNVYMGVVSNKHGEFLRHEIKHLGWEHHFGRAIGSRDTDFDKPSAFPLLESLNQTNIAPGHDVWFLGDSRVDMECARNANCVPVSLSPRAVLDDTPFISVKDCIGVIQILNTL